MLRDLGTNNEKTSVLRIWDRVECIRPVPPHVCHYFFRCEFQCPEDALEDNLEILIVRGGHRGFIGTYAHA